MNFEGQLKELLSKVNDLTGELKECRKEIDLLKGEIEWLKRKPLSTSSAMQPRAVISTTPTFENFVGLKVIHFVGIIVLIIGLTIGVKYAIDINLISPVLRILIAYLTGCGLLLTSRRLRKNYELFSMVLFSGAMASIYFTTYAAFAYYGMLSRPITFGMMLLFTIFTVFNSLKYNRQEIAILGLVGAFGIPFFVRGNTDNLWALFTYIFVINTGILFLSFKRYWLSLTYLSFFTTWIILFASLNLYPGGNYFNAQLSFGLVFFFLFMTSSLGFKIYKGDEITNSDTFIVVANTLALYLFIVISFLISDVGFIKGVTLLFAFLYFAFGVIAARYLQRHKHLHSALFSISLLAFVVFFLIQYSGLTITIIWGLLAIAYFISGMWFKLQVFRIGAIVLFASTLIKLVIVDSMDFSPIEKIIAYIFTGTVLLIVSFLYQKFKKRIFNDAENEPNGSN